MKGLFYLLLFSTLFSSTSIGQQYIPGKFRYDDIRVDKGLRPPTDTLPDAPVGSIATKGGQLFVKTIYGYYAPIGGSETFPKVVGTIYESVGFSNLSSFVNRGATAVISGNNINFSGGGGPSNFTQTLEYNRGTLMELWHISGGFISAAKSSTTYGFALGVRSTNPTSVNVAVKFDATDGSTRGRVLIYAGNNLVKTAIDSITFNAGDSIELHAERRVDTIFAWSVNVTKKITSLKTSFGYSYSTGQLTQNTGRFAVYSMGGTFDLYKLSINSNTPIRPDLLIIGDSKSAGYFANSPYDRWATIVRKSFPNLVLQAGSADRITDATDRLAETIGIQPKQVILCIGVNDVRNGLDSNTIKSSYNAYVSSLQSAGVNVIHLISPKEVSLNFEWFSNFIKRIYPNDFIDAKTEYCQNCLSGDNVHPNTKGNLMVADAVLNSGKIRGIVSSDDNSINSVLSKGNMTNIAPVIGTTDRLGLTFGGTFSQPKAFFTDTYPSIVGETNNSSFGGFSIVSKTRTGMPRVNPALFGDSVAMALVFQNYVSGGSPARTLALFAADATRNQIAVFAARQPDNDFNGTRSRFTFETWENLYVGIGIAPSANFNSIPPVFAVNNGNNKMSLFNLPVIPYDSVNYNFIANHKTNGDTYRMYAPSFSLGTSGTNLGWSLASGVYTLNVPDASAIARGVITTGAQSFAGVKTFNDKIEASELIKAKGNIGYRIRTVTANVTPDKYDHTILIDATAGAIVVTLPTAASQYDSGYGSIYIFKRVDTGLNTITITPSGSDTIDGAATANLNTAAMQSIVIQSNGSGWFVVK